MLRALLLTLPLLWPLATQAQTQAACTFNFFSPATPLKLPDGTPILFYPSGINDFGTIVGTTNTGPGRGLIRWANGGITSVRGTSWLFARNDHGTSLGLGSTGPILVNGTTITPIVLDVSYNYIQTLTGINKWGTIVGTFVDNSAAHGFKRWNAGTTHTLDFPGALWTFPEGINDDGTVVGTYFKSKNHGFIFHNGQWASLDYPLAWKTDLRGITNAGKIIGYAAFKNFPGTPFLYENGTFKVISVPNSAPGKAFFLSISPKRGLILGVTDSGAGKPVFIAQCQ